MNSSRVLTFVIIFITLLPIPAGAGDYAAVISSGTDDKPATTSSSLWNGGYDKTIFEIVVGYVNKSWICTYPSGTQREDFFGDTDKFFHGVQIGGLFTPSFDWGLGLRTGLFIEGYTSKNEWIRSWCSYFGELDLYVPLHASFRIPFTDEFGLNLFGGMGFQWAINGKYYKQTSTYRPWGRRPGYETVATQKYGNGWPQKINWQAECGFNLRYRMIAVGFTYSFGLTDHSIQNTFDDGTTYVTASRSHQDKMQVSVAFTF